MQWSRIDVYWTSLSMHENNSNAFIHSTSVMRFASLISVWNSHRIDICCIGSWNSLHAYRMVFLLIYFMIVKVMIRCQRGIFVKRYFRDFPILCVNFIPVAELVTVTSHFVAISMLISMMDFSPDVGVQWYMLLSTARGWTKDNLCVMSVSNSGTNDIMR